MYRYKHCSPEITDLSATTVTNFTHCVSTCRLACTNMYRLGTQVVYSFVSVCLYYSDGVFCVWILFFSSLATDLASVLNIFMYNSGMITYLYSCTCTCYFSPSASTVCYIMRNTVLTAYLGGMCTLLVHYGTLSYWYKNPE